MTDEDGNGEGHGAPPLNPLTTTHHKEHAMSAQHVIHHVKNVTVNPSRTHPYSHPQNGTFTVQDIEIETKDGYYITISLFSDKPVTFIGTANMPSPQAVTVPA